MRDESRGRFLLFAAAVMAAAGGFAFSPIPKESAKALGVTRGKPFTAGVVFVDGKYVEPPYVIERWGTGIRINKTPVTGQLISWNEFLKTQDGVKIEKKTVDVAPEPEKEPEPEPKKEAAQPAPAAASSIDVSSLDELFGGSSSSGKSEQSEKPGQSASALAVAATGRQKAAPAAPKQVTTYTLSGEFKPNDASRALVKRINAARTKIDRTLRAGGFICFGSNYSQVTGDKRVLLELLKALPELQQRSESVEAFRAGVRSANLIFLNELLCGDLFRNRLDYRKLKERRERIDSDQKWNQILEEVSDPVF